MSLYRVKQFYWSITSNIDSEDRKIIRKYLSSEEELLFNRLASYEQKHCVNVARDVIRCSKELNIYSNALVRAALLHDIGKTCKTLNPIEKSLMVVFDSLTKGNLKRYNRLKTVDVYYNHASKGYNILKNTGNYDERFLYLVKNHHNNFIMGDKELDILRACDSRN